MYTRYGIGQDKEESKNPFAAAIDAVVGSGKSLYDIVTGKKEEEKPKVKPGPPGEPTVELPPAQKSTFEKLLVPGLIVAAAYFITRKKKR